MVAFLDTLVWQSLASVIFPGGTIFCVVKAAKLYCKSEKMKFVPTLCGLGSIPLIIHPIDRFTDGLMDNTVRKMYK